jgi:hypothetical protein
MDVKLILRDLFAEKKRLDKAITLLEGVYDSHSRQAPASSADTSQTAPVRRRGRKSMGNAEREQVSKRMKAYWSKNKKGQDEQ